MTALVSVETVLLVVLLVLVAGLLRSHAELLRRLGPESNDADETRPAPAARVREPTSGPAPRRPAPALRGVTPTGDAVALDFAHAGDALTLLAFLTTGCATCAGFWQTLAEPRLPEGVETVIVAHGSDRERVSRVAALAPEGVPVLMSSQAWSDYEVPGAPYFVLAGRAILGEGVASTWPALASLVRDAIEEEQEAGAALPLTRVPAGRTSSTTRAHRIDETLAAGGIGPDHPSLYPGGRG
jgi:hypothetical protein